MRTDEAEVSSKKKVVGVAKYMQVENWTDLEHLRAEKGEAFVLDTLNIQIKTCAMNAVRQKNSGVPSKETLRKLAYERLAQDLGGIQVAAAQGGEGIERLVQATMEIIKKEYEARVPAQVEGDSDDDDDNT